jgi:integrase
LTRELDMSLTVVQARNAKPGRHSDGNGLYLLVKPSGSKSWVLRVQHRGRRQDFGLGSFAAEAIDVDLDLHRRRSLTLAEAREKARIGRELAKGGVSPSVVWRHVPDEIPTFRRAAEMYHGQVSKGWRNGKHRDQWLNTLKTYAFPVIGNLSVDEVDAPAIQRAVLPIWLTKGETARRVRQRIGVVLDFAHGKGWRKSEAPMRALNQLLGGLKQPKGGNFSAMPYKQLPDFMTKVRDGEFSVGRLALQFLVLTAARSGEVRKAHWRDIDLEAAEWRVPPENAKTARVHIVPLAPAAMEILESLREVLAAKPDGLVFPGLKGVMSDATLTKVLRVGGGGEFTVHGFRSSFRDWAAETGFADAWAEAALAHINPNRTESAYRRTTFFEQRKGKLMPAWASFVTGRSSNVVLLADLRA